MKKKKKTVFRYGDKVKVVTPELFIRCGYPKTIESETKIVIEEQGESIKNMLKNLGLKEPIGLYDTNTYFSRAFKKIAREIAYCRLKQNGFGGGKREIYTQTEPDIKGKTFQVINKRRVKTGEYHPPSWCYDSWCGGNEYEPGYLSNGKTHVILEISPCDMIRFIHDKPMEIEEVHVEKAGD